MRKLLLLAAAAAAVAVVAATPAGAVQGGTPDTGNVYPYVGMSVYYDAAGVPLWRCSGTLVAPQIYVTAGHCTGFDPDPDVNTSPVTAQVFFGLGPFARGNWAGPGTTCNGKTGYPCVGTVAGLPIPHPQWTGFLTVPNTHDTGVVVLATPAPVASFARLAPAGYLDRLANARGQQNVNFTVVGYGVQIERPNLEVALVQRQIGTTQLQDLRSALAGGYEVRMTDAAGGGTGGSGTCFGDSGGPVFHTSAAGVQYLVGDISWGTKYCKGTSAAYRLDQESARSFLGRFVALP
jgi:secreted trypsin-like serine protease